MSQEAARPRGLLGPCILLLLAEAPRHGYQLIGPLKAFGFDWGGPGPIYQELRKLFSAGLVRSAWEQSGGPARRVYEPTETGMTSLADSVRSAAEEAELVCTLIAKAQRTTLATPAQPVGADARLASNA